MKVVCFQMIEKAGSGGWGGGGGGGGGACFARMLKLWAFLHGLHALVLQV